MTEKHAPTPAPPQQLEPGEFIITRGDGVQEIGRYVGQSISIPEISLSVGAPPGICPSPNEEEAKPIAEHLPGLFNLYTRARRGLIFSKRMQVVRAMERTMIEAEAPSPPQAETPDGWISVEEKLPPKSDEYLAVDSGQVLPADYFCELEHIRDAKWTTVRSFGNDCEEQELHAVTHWRPLPSPPLSSKEE